MITKNEWIGALGRYLIRTAEAILTGIYIFAVWILVVAVYFLASRVVSPLTDSPTLSTLATFALLIGQETILILIHELGHASAAWFLGWRVRNITVFRLTLRPLAGLWEWNAERKGLDVGGWVYSTPPETGASTLHSIVIYAAGPLANFAFATLCLGYIAFHPVRSDAVYFLLQTTGWLSFMTGALNLIPVKLSGGLKSDGYQLISLMIQRVKFRAPVSKTYAIHRLFADLKDGVPPFESDLRYLDYIWRQDDEEALKHEDLILIYAIMEGNLHRIRDILARRLARGESLTTDERSLLALAYLLLDRDIEAASEHLDLVPPEDRLEAYSYWRSMAALLHFSGAHNAALNAAEIARKCAQISHEDMDEDEEAILRAIEAGLDLPRSPDPVERRKRFLLRKRRPHRVFTA